MNQLLGIGREGDEVEDEDESTCWSDEESIQDNPQRGIRRALKRKRLNSPSEDDAEDPSNGLTAKFLSEQFGESQVQIF